jgi:hypothetical protein
MKECIKCKASVATQKKQCPVCFNELEPTTENNDQIWHYNMSKYNDNVSNKNAFLIKLFLFLTISISSICLFLNFTFSPETFWSLVVIVPMLYLWILVRHTIISRRGNFEKILFQFIGILAVVLTSNMVAGGEDWFWLYIVPSSSIVAATILTFVLLINKKRSDFVFSFFLMSVFLIVLSVVLLLINVTTFKLLYFISLLYNALFAFGILVFGFKSLKRGFLKTFHI